jgi:hypothetical protein
MDDDCIVTMIGVQQCSAVGGGGVCGGDEAR